MEGTHGELGSGLADGLCSDDADCFAEFDEAARGKVAAVAENADAALGFAGEHGANLDALNAGSLDGRSEIFCNLLVDFHDDRTLEVLDPLERNAADDTVAQRFDDFAGLDDRSNVDAFHRAAVMLADDDVLGHVNESTGQVAGVSGLQCGIRQALTCAVGRDEVLQHGETFAEVCRDRGLNDFAGRLGHEAAHAGELTDLLFGSASAGVGHDVDRVHGAGLVGVLHVVEHFVGNFFRYRRPDLDDLVVALAVGDGAVKVLVLNADSLLFRVAHHGCTSCLE